MQIRKSDGTLQSFAGEKLERALTRAQVNPRVITDILTTLPRLIRPGTSTQHIHARVLHMLESADPVGAARYNLKHAMFLLGPSGFPFEHYVARLLQAYGWKAEVSKMVPGACVQHEIDVYAERDGAIRAIEAKYRNRPSGRVDIKTALYVHARHQDLLAYNPAVEGALFTNTQFTDSARAYGECVNMKMKGWNYPQDEGIAKYIEQKQLYPLTVFSRIPTHVVARLARDGIVLVSELCKLSEAQLRQYDLDVRLLPDLQQHATALCATPSS